MPVPTASDPRVARGFAIAATPDSIRREGSNKWHVPSQSVPAVAYLVTRFARSSTFYGRTRWQCSCPDHQQRGVLCKHIYAVQFTEAARKNLQTTFPAPKPRKPRATRGFPAPAPEPAEPQGVTCKWCGSAEWVRNGHTAGKQEYRCRAATCGRKFVLNAGFARIKAEPKVVLLALDLHFKGNSLRQITDTLAQFFSLDVDHTTVYRWLNRYVALINDYVRTLEPWVGDKWHADEVFTKFNGDLQYLWHVMDADTRYLLVSKVTAQRDDGDARSVMREAARLAGKAPDEIVTDGLPAYVRSVRTELRGAEHTREIHLSKPERMPNNNKVERLNGTVRQRQKVTRGLKKPDGPLTKGQAAFYNHVRPHQALDGRTPGEAAGVGLKRKQDESRWAALVREAARQREAEEAAGEA